MSKIKQLHGIVFIDDTGDPATTSLHYRPLDKASTEPTKAVAPAPMGLQILSRDTDPEPDAVSRELAIPVLIPDKTLYNIHTLPIPRIREMLRYQGLRTFRRADVPPYLSGQISMRQEAHQLQTIWTPGPNHNHDTEINYLFSVQIVPEEYEHGLLFGNRGEIYLTPGVLRAGIMPEVIKRKFEYGRSRPVFRDIMVANGIGVNL